MVRVARVFERFVSLFYILTISFLLTFDQMQYSYLIFCLVANFYLFWRVKDFMFLKRSMLFLVAGRFILMLHDFVFLGLQLSEKASALSHYNRASITVYLIASIFYNLSIGDYFIKMTKLWNKFQLILDVAFYAFGAAFTIYVFFLKKMIADISLFSIDFIILLLIANGVLIFAQLAIIIFKDASVKKSSFKQLFIIGYIIYFIADIVFLFDYYLGVGGILLSLRNVLTCSTTVTFVMGVKSVSGKYEEELLPNSELDITKVSFNRTFLLSLAVAIPIIVDMFFTNNLIEVTYFLIVGLIYFSVSIIHQKTLVSDELIVRQNKVRRQLEDMVLQKKRQLEYANTVLHITSEMDNLTKLNNRDFFFRYVSDLIASDNISFSMFYLDLDNFKIINDLHGHHIGDKVLLEIAKRFSNYSMSNFVVSRMGGDEFSLIYNRTDEFSLHAASRRIIAQISKPIEVDELSFKVGVSIGIARYPQDAKTVDDLLKYSDAAMYHAKSTKTSEKYYLYSHDLFLQLDRKNRIELLLRSADINNDFELHYQPVVNLKSNQVVGCEALLRWFQPSEGSISPADFIPIAEEIGMIYDLSKWVVEQAIVQMIEWHNNYDYDMRVAVNLSPKLFVDDRFLKHVQKLINETGANPQNLIFEITEHSAMMPSSFVKDALTTLSEMGVNISIDDFGTGYSSLIYIKRFKFDIIKIAQSLIDDIAYNKNNHVIVNAIILMARGLKLATVAEGVEKPEQLEILKRMGCNFVQGFIYSEALTKEQFEARFLHNLEAKIK